MNNAAAFSSTTTNRPLSGAAPRDGRAVIYPRVSSTRQLWRDHDPEGISIPAQGAACRRRAEQLGLTIVDEYVEPGRSALEVSKRTAFQRMLARVRDSDDIDHVIVYKLSRLAQTTPATAATTPCGVRTKTDPDQGQPPYSWCDERITLRTKPQVRAQIESRVDLTYHYTNRSVLVTAPEITLRPVGTRRASAVGDAR